MFKNNKGVTEATELASTSNAFKNIYLVDFENVKAEGLKNIEKLSEIDAVHIFYSDLNTNISIATANALNDSPAYIKYHVFDAEENVDSYQLSSYLGYLLHQNANSVFYVVSENKGFNLLSKYWEKFGITINISNVIPEKNVTTNTANTNKKSTVETKDDISEIKNIKDLKNFAKV